MPTLKDIKVLAVKDSSFRRSLLSNIDSALSQRNLRLSSTDLTALKREVSALKLSKTARELDAFFADTKSALGWSD